MNRRKRDLAMFNLAIDSKLRGCDLVSLRVDDVASGGRVRDLAIEVDDALSLSEQVELLTTARPRGARSRRARAAVVAAMRALDPLLPFPVGTRYGRNVHLSGPSVEQADWGWRLG
jgi:hypothetical protein